MRLRWTDEGEVAPEEHVAAHVPTLNRQVNKDVVMTGAADVCAGDLEHVAVASSAPATSTHAAPTDSGPHVIPTKEVRRRRGCIFAG